MFTTTLPCETTVVNDASSQTVDPTAYTRIETVVSPDGGSDPGMRCRKRWPPRCPPPTAWFRRRVAGEDAGFLYSSEADPDGEFDHIETADAEQDFATYLREIDLARQAAARRELDETFFHSTAAPR
jgi:hypothetical protein